LRHCVAFEAASQPRTSLLSGIEFVCVAGCRGAMPTLAWACRHDRRASGGSDARSIAGAPLTKKVDEPPGPSPDQS
jgi:hypothetical protein